MGIVRKHEVNDDVKEKMEKLFRNYYVIQISRTPHQYGGAYFVEYGVDPNQYGEGFGAIFSALKSIFRPLAPLLMRGLTKAGKAVGKQALLSGMDMLGDVSRGATWEDAANNNLVEGAKSLVDRGVNKLDTMVGRGVKRKRRRSTRKSKGGDVTHTHLGPSQNNILQRLISLRSASGTRGHRNVLRKSALEKHHHHLDHKGRGYTLL